MMTPKLGGWGLRLNDPEYALPAAWCQLLRSHRSIMVCSRPRASQCPLAAGNLLSCKTHDRGSNQPLYCPDLMAHHPGSPSCSDRWGCTKNTHRLRCDFHAWLEYLFGASCNGAGLNLIDPTEWPKSGLIKSYY